MGLPMKGAATFSLLLFTVHQSLTFPLSSPPPFNVAEEVYVTELYNVSVCVIDGIPYEDGESIPTIDPCESCICHPPGFACKVIRCKKPPRGCIEKAKTLDDCCPKVVCDDSYNLIYRIGDENATDASTGEPEIVPELTNDADSPVEEVEDEIKEEDLEDHRPSEVPNTEGGTTNRSDDAIEVTSVVSKEELVTPARTEPTTLLVNYTINIIVDDPITTTNGQPSSQSEEIAVTTEKQGETSATEISQTEPSATTNNVTEDYRNFPDGNVSDNSAPEKTTADIVNPTEGSAQSSSDSSEEKPTTLTDIDLRHQGETSDGKQSIKEESKTTEKTEDLTKSQPEESSTSTPRGQDVHEDKTEGHDEVRTESTAIIKDHNRRDQEDTTVVPESSSSFAEDSKSTSGSSTDHEETSTQTQQDLKEVKPDQHEEVNDTPAVTDDNTDTKTKEKPEDIELGSSIILEPSTTEYSPQEEEVVASKVEGTESEKEIEALPEIATDQVQTKQSDVPIAKETSAEKEQPTESELTTEKQPNENAQSEDDVSAVPSSAARSVDEDGKPVHNDDQSPETSSESSADSTPEVKSAEETTTTFLPSGPLIFPTAEITINEHEMRPRGTDNDTNLPVTTTEAEVFITTIVDNEKFNVFPLPDGNVTLNKTEDSENSATTVETQEVTDDGIDKSHLEDEGKSAQPSETTSESEDSSSSIDDNDKAALSTDLPVATSEENPPEAKEITNTNETAEVEDAATDPTKTSADESDVTPKVTFHSGRSEDNPIEGSTSTSNVNNVTQILPENLESADSTPDDSSSNSELSLEGTTGKSKSGNTDNENIDSVTAEQSSSVSVEQTTDQTILGRNLNDQTTLADETSTASDLPSDEQKELNKEETTVVPFSSSFPDETSDVSATNDPEPEVEEKSSSDESTPPPEETQTETVIPEKAKKLDEETTTDNNPSSTLSIEGSSDATTQHSEILPETQEDTTSEAPHGQHNARDLTDESTSDPPHSSEATTESEESNSPLLPESSAQDESLHKADSNSSTISIDEQTTVHDAEESSTEHSSTSEERTPVDESAISTTDELPPAKPNVRELSQEDEQSTTVGSDQTPTETATSAIPKDDNAEDPSILPSETDSSVKPYAEHESSTAKAEVDDKPESSAAPEPKNEVQLESSPAPKAVDEGIPESSTTQKADELEHPTPKSEVDDEPESSAAPEPKDEVQPESSPTLKAVDEGTPESSTTPKADEPEHPTTPKADEPEHPTTPKADEPEHPTTPKADELEHPTTPKADDDKPETSSADDDKPETSSANDDKPETSSAADTTTDSPIAPEVKSRSADHPSSENPKVSSAHSVLEESDDDQHQAALSSTDKPNDLTTQQDHEIQSSATTETVSSSPWSVVMETIFSSVQPSSLSTTEE